MENDRSNIELVKERSDIVSVVEKYVNLKQSGHNFSGLCPFHGEKTPSFNVNTQLQIYKCFGCGKSGDVINFVQEIEKLDFPQALEKLAHDAGIELKNKNIEVSPVYQINEWARIFYQKELYKSANKFALDYVKSRGITDKQIKEFGIGFAPGNTDFLSRLLKFKSYSKEILIDSGLFVEKNQSLKERFNKRVMFSIFNNSGKVIGFSGRLLPGNEYGPKYLNTPETSIYHKGRVLYGFNFAKGSVRKDDLCIILEGNTDLMSMHRVGYTNSVAPMGTGLTQDQLNLISNYTKNILFLFDNDKAGQSATERGFRLALETGLTCYSANTGKYKDVDELISDNSEILKDIIDKRTDTFSYLLSRKAEEIGTDNLKSIAYLSKYAKGFIDAVSDETEKSFFISKAKSIIPQLELGTPVLNNTNLQQINTQEVKLDIEDMFLKAIFEKENFAELKALNPEFLKKASSVLIYNYVLEMNIDTPKELYERATNLQLKNIIERILLSNAQSGDIETLRKRLTIRNIENEVKTLRVKLAIAEEKEDTTETNLLLKKILELTNNLKKYKDEDLRL